MEAWLPPDEAARELLRTLFADESLGRRSSDGGPDPAGTSGVGDPHGRDPSARTFPLTEFQEAAVGRVRAVIERRGGAILADAVGLGKTYVAVALIEERLSAGHDVLVMVPAATRGVWARPLRRLGGDASRRKLASHTQLSRGIGPTPGPNTTLLVVDEAHRFRNPATRRYGALARMVDAGHRVGPGRVDGAGRAGVGRGTVAGPGRPDLLLITATPVNNSPEDLLHLIRLFLPDDGLRDAGVPSVAAVFDGPAPDDAGLQAVSRALVIRRSRGMIHARFGAASPLPGVRFPRRAPPALHRYAAASVGSAAAAIEGLELPAHDPGAAALVRLGLLKRLDSSAAAAAISLRRLRSLLEAFREAAMAGRLLRPDHRLATGDADPLQLILVGVVAPPAPPDADLRALAEAADRDREVVEAVLAGMEAVAADDDSDAKLGTLRSLLAELHPDPVLVFTEYRDTAEAIWRALTGHRSGEATPLRVGRIDGSGAWLGRSPAGRRAVVERFAPRANGRPVPPDRERVDVLVATDVLAEGLNLQDARHVISYDLPWNPVRLLQRIGRADRLGSPHQTVVPHLFVPAEGLDHILGLTRRLRSKLHGISAAIGEPRADELLTAIAAGRPAAVDEVLAAAEEATASPWERLRTLRWRRCGPGTALPPPAAPWVAELLLSPGHPAAGLDAVVLVTRGQAASYEPGTPSDLLEVTRAGRVRPLGEAGVAAVGAALDGGAPPDTAGANRGRHPPAGQTDRVRRVVDLVTDHLRGTRLAARAPARLVQRDTRRLVARLRGALAGQGSALGPHVLAGAEAALAALETPLSPTRRRAVAELLESPPDDPAALVAGAVHALRPRSVRSRDRPAEQTRIQGVILVRRGASEPPPETG